MSPGFRGWDETTSRDREVRKDGVGDPQEMWAEVKEECSWCSVIALGRTLRISILKEPILT